MGKITAKICAENMREMKLSERKRQERNGLLYGYQALEITREGVRVAFELRISKSARGAWYASAWKFESDYTSATASTPSNDRAGGYDKRGAVTAEALRRLGYSFSEEGQATLCNEDAKKLLIAMCEAENIKRFYIVEMHA